MMVRGMTGMLVEGRKRSGDIGDMLHTWETRQDGLGWHVVSSGLRAVLTLLPNPARYLRPVKLETVLVWPVSLRADPCRVPVLALCIQ